MEEEQPTQGKKSNNTILIVVIIVVVIGLAAAIYFFTQGEDENTNANTVATTNTVTTNTNTTQEQDTDELSGSERQEFIQEAVQSATSDITFPVEVDQVTTVTGIVATPTAIRYEYTLHDIDESLLSDELLKNGTMPSLCQTAETRIDILDRGINMEYSYQVENSTQTYFFSVSKEDCI